MRTKIYYLNLFTVFSAILLLLWFFAILLFPFKPVEFKSFTIINNSVQRGDYVEYKLNFKKNMPIKPEIRWYIVDGTTVILNTDGVNRPVGNNTTISSKQIPNTINPGVYKLQVDLVYEITPFRKIYYSWQSNSFNIL